MDLDISVNSILSIDADIQSVKQLVRRYGKRSNYKFWRQCMVSITNYALTSQPLPSSLSLQPSPILLVQEPPAPLVRSKMLHVHGYAYELLAELEEELREFGEQPLRKLGYEEAVRQIYSSQESTFRNMRVGKRKAVNEILEILNIIAEHLFHEFEEYSPQRGTIEFETAPYSRESFLLEGSFLRSLDCLVYNEIFLHDPNIMHNLSVLVENEVFFSYRHHIRVEKQLLKKYQRRNSREELPGESNLGYVNNITIGKARIAHFSLLLNRHRDSVAIQPIHDQLRMLLLAPGNDRSNAINKILVKKTEAIEGEADRLIALFQPAIDSRFYHEKVFGLLSDFLTSGYKFTPQQVVAIVAGHVPLIQSQNIKVKEHSLKSLEKFFKALHKADLFGPVEDQLRQYIQRDKL